MTPPKRGEGQTALITGASSGIGVDLAECFAEDGYALILAARTGSALLEVAERLTRVHGVRATAIAIDLEAAGSGRRLADDIARRRLSVDVVVNNAGYGRVGSFEGSDAAVELGMIDLNVRALVELTQIYWPGILARRRGGILNVASTAAFQPGPLMAVYFASKAFVLSFTEALWEEARGRQVKVSCLCPGSTVSGFRERAGSGGTRRGRLVTSMSSRVVAAEGYRAWQDNRRVAITGLRNRVVARLVPFLPRRVVLRIVGRLQSPD